MYYCFNHNWYSTQSPCPACSNIDISSFRSENKPYMTDAEMIAKLSKKGWHVLHDIEYKKLIDRIDHYIRLGVEMAEKAFDETFKHYRQ